MSETTPTPAPSPAAAPAPSGAASPAPQPTPLRAKSIAYAGVNLAFPSPIHANTYQDVDEMNAHLKQFILDWRDKEPGEHRSNLGGWHGPDSLLPKLGEPYAPRLAQMFLAQVKHCFQLLVEGTPPVQKVHIEAWANVNDKGHANRPHIHPGCPWSGVYYVAGDPASSGAISFTDPRTQALMTHHALSPWVTTNNVKVEPKPGTMVVFPSFLYHAVPPSQSDEPRISIAFNLR